MLGLQRFIGNPSFDRGRSLIIEALWLSCSALMFSTWLPGSNWRRGMLRLFGAKIGRGVLIKPFVKIKFPWRLRVDDFGGIGERVWIDNLAQVTIGANAWLSQDVYVCTGNHDWGRLDLPLLTREITLEEDVWVGARAVLGPGAKIGRGAVVTLGTIVLGEVPPWAIVGPGPMIRHGDRRLREAPRQAVKAPHEIEGAETYSD
jgi:putative colanic acid biosynthesis acetyltransferase WcaF